MNPIIIATPHPRNDTLVQHVQEYLDDFQVMRIAEPAELSFEFLSSVNPDWIFFPHWSWIIPEAIFARFRCVIFHMTDVPYGRGGSPLQNLIVRGHTQTMLSAIQCVKELDAGPIYLKRPLILAGSAEEILSRASSLIGEMIVEIVRAAPTPQVQTGLVTIFNRRQPKDSDLSGLIELNQIYDQIRMLDAAGYPAAFIQNESVIYEFYAAENYGQWIDAKVRIKRRE
jgi:methionyl-tRNA formyltransferase